MKVTDLELLESVILGEGGFVQLCRSQVRNVRADGSRSAVYTLDVVERPGRCDAVAVALHGPDAGGDTPVILRRGLRPARRYGRRGQPTRLGERPSLHHLEVVAGILEPDDVGRQGVISRAIVEIEEEVGLHVAARDVAPLGEPVYLSPGLMAEQIFFCRARVSSEALERSAATPVGDGTLLEESGEVVVCPLGQALEDCRSGVIQDAKTEVALRRLDDHLNPVRSPG